MQQVSRLQEVIQKLKEFNKDLSIRSLRERYSSPSFFEMMSISRMENQHSAFIKWLLQGDDIMVNPKYSPLMGLLDILVERSEQQGVEKEITPIIKNAILSRTIRLSNIIAKCERTVGELKVFGKSQDRIDIHLVCDVKGVSEIDQFEFIIENKVGSKEGDEKLGVLSLTDTNDEEKKARAQYNSAKQTERYVLGTTYNAGNKPDFIKDPGRLYQFYVFLTPISSARLSNYDELEEDETCASNKFIHINYQDIVDYIIEPALSSNSLSDRVRVFLNEYLNNLSMPCEEEYDNKKKNTKKNTIIMATYNLDKNAMIKLWKEYQELILYSIILEKALIIEEYPTRQDLFNANIVAQGIKSLKEYVWPIQNKNSTRIEVNNNNQRIFVKDVSDPTIKIKRINEFNDLFVLTDFFKENKNLLLSVMKILSDEKDTKYDTVRDVYNTLANPKDYTKYVIKYNGNALNDSKGNIKVMNKREVVVAFVENLGHKMTESFNENNTYELFFNNKNILPGITVYVGEKPKNSIRYNAYKWDRFMNNYINQGVADKANGDIYFSNQWGCNNNKDGTFDKFLQMVSKHFTSFKIIRLEEYNKSVKKT